MNANSITQAPKQEVHRPKLTVHMIGSRNGWMDAHEVLRGLGIYAYSPHHGPSKEIVEEVLEFITDYVARESTMVGEYPDKHILTCDDATILAVRLAVKRGLVMPENVTIKWYPSSLGYCSRTIRVDKNGALSEYPDGFLDTWNNVLLELDRP